MHFKLTIPKKGGHGFISVIDNHGIQLAGAQKDSDTVAKMAQDLSMNDKYVVGIENGEEEMSWIVEEADDPKVLYKLQQEAIQQTSKKVDDSKQSLEFTRYKQDCRKRALDIAVISASDYISRLGREVKDGKTIPKAEDIIPVFADKYYNWLISIPE